MHSLGELVDRAADGLADRRDGGIATYQRPLEPACIFYLGKRSTALHGETFAALQGVWGAAAATLPYLSVADPADVQGDAASLRAVNARSGDPADAKALQAAVMDMMGQGALFDSLNECALYFVIDTSTMDPSQFKEWYKAAQRVKPFLRGIQLRSMLIVLVDYSLGTGTAHDVTAALADLFEEERAHDSRAFNGTMVFGNQRRDGAYNDLFKVGSPVRMIVPNAIALSNTAHEGLRGCRKLLFDSSAPAITGALSVVEKPRHDIVVGLLRAMVDITSREIAARRKERPSDAVVKAALGIDGSNSTIVSGFTSAFNKIADSFRDFERWLPIIGGSEPIASDEAYGMADKRSGGCLSAFVALNHMRALDDLLSDGGSDDLDALIARGISSALDAAGILALSEREWMQRVDAAYADLRVYGASAARQPIRDAIISLMSQHVLDFSRERTKAVLSELINRAQGIVNEVRELVSQVSLFPSSDKGGTHVNVEGYYDKVVRAFYTSPEKREALVRSLLDVGDDAPDLLTALYEKGLVPLFGSSYGGVPIFSLDFMDEMVERLSDGKSDDAAQKVVGRELVEDVSDRMGYRTIIPLPERSAEAYLLHIDNDLTSASGKLYRYLQEAPLPSGVNRSFLGLSSRERATSLWFYRLGVEHLRN